MNYDWREQGQEKYLFGLQFKKQKYKKYNKNLDHDHCEFCGTKFCEILPNENCIEVGYSTSDNYRWICEKCFKDFNQKYNLIEVLS